MFLIYVYTGINGVADMKMEVLDIPSYSTHLLEHLNLLRQEQMFCDVTITCQNSTMSVHQVVLQAASPYFDQCIKKSVSGDCVIDFSRFDEKLLQVVIDFLYSSKLRVCNETVGNLMEICDELHLQSAVDACNFYIEYGNQKHKEIDTQTDTVDIEITQDNVTETPVRRKRRAAAINEDISPEVSAKTKKVETAKSKRARKAYKPRQRKETSKKVTPIKITKASETNEEEEDTVFKVEESVLDYDGAEIDANNADETTEAIVKIEKSDIESKKAQNEFENNINDDAVDDEDDFEDDNDDDSGTDDYDSNVLDDSQNSLATNENIKRIDADGKVLKKKVRKKKEGPAEGKSKKRRRKPFPCSMCSKTLTSKKRQIFHEYSKHGTPIDFKNITFTVSPCSVEASLFSFYLCNKVLKGHTLQIYFNSTESF